MSNYFHLSSSNDEEYFILRGDIYDSKHQLVDTIFNSGESLLEAYKETVFTIVANTKKSYPGQWVDNITNFVSDAGKIFIASDKACALFAKLGLHNLEYYDVSIQWKNEIIDGYKIINVVGKIDCINDHESSIEYRSDNSIEEIDKLVFDETKIPKNMKILLLGKHYSRIVFVHKTVVDAITENLQGFQLTPLHDYQY